MRKKIHPPGQKPATDDAKGSAEEKHHRQRQRRSIEIGGILWTIHQAHILQMSAKSISRKRIAKALGISENTLRNEINDIYRNLGINSKEELIRWAILSRAEDVNLPPDE